MEEARAGEGAAGLKALLASSGGLGRDLLAVDWEQTPIGPIEAWPGSLRTVVSALISSRFSMWMAWGPELTFFCNEAYRRDTLAQKYPWALGRPASEVWAEIWPEIGPRIETVMSTGEATWDEALLLILERNGYEEETYHTFSYSPLYDDAGETAGLLCVVSEDTERIIGERRMATLRDIGSVTANVGDERGFLIEAARQLQGNQRSIPFAAIYLFDDQGGAELVATTGFASGATAVPVRLSPQELEAMPAVVISRGESLEVMVDGLAHDYPELPTGPWPKVPDQAIAVALQSAAGERPVGFLILGANRYRPVDDDFRSFAHLIAQRIGAGIASARAYRAELQRAEQLAELDRVKTNFLSTVSHELRTPLTLMLAPLQDALDAAAPLEVQQVELVRRNGLRLLKLVNALLDFSRLEAGRLSAEFHPVDVGTFTTDLVGTFSDACQRAGIELIVEVGELRGPVYLDPDLWERIVLNLVSNAFKFTLGGAITVRLEEAAQGGFSMSVSDTGPGIAPEQLTRIFERFHRVRTAEARSQEGAGIGLALVKELVELHGGEVTVHSVFGKGATFVVTLPYGRDHLPDEHVDEIPTAAVPGISEMFTGEASSWLPSDGDTSVGGTAARGVGARVLVADDNPDLRLYLTHLLEPHLEVEVVADGLEALARVRENPPDLLVTDAMMPGLDGFELIAAIRSAPATRDLPVIMLSAHAGEEASIEGLRAGADDYVPKPFSGRELLARVQAHLELSRLRLQASAEVRARMRQLTELQTSLLPPGLPDPDGLEVAVAFHPGDRALEVGGDFYDLFQLDHDTWGLVIGDVCGHGAVAAAVTALTRHTTRAVARLTQDPGEVLADVSETLRLSGYDRYCTAIYGRLRACDEGFALTLATGGHPLPVIHRGSGEVEVLERHGPLLGVFADTSIPTVSTRLEVGDTLVLYTDGLVERNPLVADASELTAKVAALSTGPAGQQLAELQAAVVSLVPGETHDDIAVMMVRASPPRPSET